MYKYKWLWKYAIIRLQITVSLDITSEGTSVGGILKFEFQKNQEHQHQESRKTNKMKMNTWIGAADQMKSVHLIEMQCRCFDLVNWTIFKSLLVQSRCMCRVCVCTNEVKSSQLLGAQARQPTYLFVLCFNNHKMMQFVAYASIRLKH